MIRLGEMFENHMVLQCRKPVHIWGSSSCDGGQISVKMNGGVWSGMVVNGRFALQLPAMEPGGPYQMEISDPEQTVLLEDILIGEVWLAGGQSNMEMPLFASEGAEAYLNRTVFQNLRFKTVSRKTRPSPEREYGFHFIPESSDPVPWTAADPESAPYFSAIGAVAGARLQQELGIPVGIISCNFGATRVQPWVSEKALRSEPVFAGDIETFFERRRALGPEAERSWQAFQAALRSMMDTRASYVPSSFRDPLFYCWQDGELCWPPEYAVGDHNEPGCLYATMLSRVFPFSMRGVLWYQGESSATLEDCYRYADEMKALIDDWRASFQDDSLCFVQAQLAPYDTSRRRDPCDWASLRQAQVQVCSAREHVYLTSLIGIGEPRLIHPRYKIEAGTRMADTALTHVYGRPFPQPPAALSMVRDGDWLRIEIQNGAGLHRTDEALQLEAGDQDDFEPAAEFKVEQDCLLIRTRHTKVRYGWSGYPTQGFVNGDGLALMPFLLQED